MLRVEFGLVGHVVFEKSGGRGLRETEGSELSPQVQRGSSRVEPSVSEAEAQSDSNGCEAAGRGS